MNVMKHSGKLDIDGNVFGRLINASIENEEEFDDDKVVGNLFIFFFAYLISDVSFDTEKVAKTK